MTSNSFSSARPHGFALIVTLSLMILLTVIAVGLLSLSSISLRGSASQSASNVAKSNARVAMMLALGDLQKAAGDGRRVTVDGSIYDGAGNPNVVGVWKSWSPKIAENPLAVAPNYTSAKDSRFVTWLASSGNPSDLVLQDWAKTGKLATPMDLFTLKSDGFLLSGSKLEVLKGTPSAGAMAWAIVQDATRSKIELVKTAEPVRSTAMSQILGSQFISHGHGRSVNPYFFASIKADGSGMAGTGKSIRFKPGEVRVFAPNSQTDVEFLTTNSIRKRTLPLRPVDNPHQLSARGRWRHSSTLTYPAPPTLPPTSSPTVGRALT